MTDKIFPEGISAFKPHEKSPDWVIANLSINPKAFGEWLRANKQHIDEKGYLKIDVLLAKSGKYYTAVNTYKPEPKQPAPPEQNSSDFQDDAVPF